MTLLWGNVKITMSMFICRQECDTIQSEMSEEFRKQKEEWHEKESELHSLVS